MKYIIILIAIVLWLSCSKSGGDTPVPPPTDTTTTHPPIDTTHSGGTDTTHQGGTGNIVKHVQIPMSPVNALFIAASNGVVIGRFDAGATGTLRFDVDNRLGNYLNGDFSDSLNGKSLEEPTQFIDTNGDAIISWNHQASSSSGTMPLSDTSHFVYFKYTKHDASKSVDTTWYEFPQNVRVRGKTGIITNRTMDSLVNISTGFDGLVQY